LQKSSETKVLKVTSHQLRVIYFHVTEFMEVRKIALSHILNNF